MTVSFAGAHHWPVKILAETAKRYRVKCLRRTCLPNKGWVPAGFEVLVPKDSVKLEEKEG